MCLSSITIKIEISAGLTPPILDACASVLGFILASFPLFQMKYGQWLNSQYPPEF